MKRIILFSIVFFCISTLTNAQNTTFNNVSIGTDGPAYGVKIKANFPGLNGTWARGFYVTNENGNQNFITLGSIGNITNGITTVSNSYIGTDYNNQYMTFLQNGNIGIGTTSPSAKLDVFGNSGEATNIILSADYANSQRWRLKTIDRGNAIDLDFTVSNYADDQEQALRLTRSNSGRPEFQLYNNAIVANDGNVGIGTANPTSKLTVAGNINSREVKVTVDAGADFVFENNYNIPSLKSVDKYIKENKHLPEIASASEMKKDGINLSEMTIKLLQKIEELTLYSIQQNKKIEILEKKVELLLNK